MFLSSYVSEMRRGYLERNVGLVLFEKEVKGMEDEGLGVGILDSGILF